MKTKTKNIIKGAGSILEIMPKRRSLNLSRFVPRETPNDMIANAWRRVGADIEAAIGQVASETSQKSS